MIGRSYVFVCSTRSHVLYSQERRFYSEMIDIQRKSVDSSITGLVLNEGSVIVVVGGVVVVVVTSNPICAGICRFLSVEQCFARKTLLPRCHS